MRVVYLETDRADRGHCVKNLEKKMQTSRKYDMQNADSEDSTVAIHSQKRQRMPKMMTCYRDSDHAGDVEIWRSTVDK